MRCCCCWLLGQRMAAAGGATALGALGPLGAPSCRRAPQPVPLLEAAPRRLQRAFDIGKHLYPFAQLAQSGASPDARCGASARRAPWPFEPHQSCARDIEYRAICGPPRRLARRPNLSRRHAAIRAGRSAVTAPLEAEATTAFREERPAAAASPMCPGAPLLDSRRSAQPASPGSRRAGCCAKTCVSAYPGYRRPSAH